MISLSTLKDKLGCETGRAAIAGAVFLSLAAAAPNGANAGDLALPLWQEIFNSDGSLVDAYDANGVPGANGVADHAELWGGISARFLDDVLSNGEAVDLSSYNGAEDLSEGIVDNGLVSAGADLGNAFAFVSENASGEMEIYVGVERLVEKTKTYIDVEINQDAVTAGTGRPWPMTGERTNGDIRVRAEFKRGVLMSSSVGVWNAAAGDFLTVSSGRASNGCVSDSGLSLVCDGATSMDSENDLGRYSENDVALDPILPDAFLEAGVNVEALLGYRPEFSAIQIRTSEDISLSGI